MWGEGCDGGMRKDRIFGAVILRPFVCTGSIWNIAVRLTVCHLGLHTLMCAQFVFLTSPRPTA